MAAYVPPGWPSGVHPPGSEDFERTAVAWLLEVVPADYRLYGVLRRYPLALGAMAVHHADACVAGARSGYRVARSELGDALPPHGLDAVLSAYRAEGRRLVGIARAATLVSRALRGEVFSPQLADAPGQSSAPEERAPGGGTPGGGTPGGGTPGGGTPGGGTPGGGTPGGGTAGGGTPGEEVSGDEAPGKQARGKTASSKEARGKDVPGKEPSGKKTRGKEAANKEVGGREASAPASEKPAQLAGKGSGAGSRG